MAAPLTPKAVTGLVTTRWQPRLVGFTGDECSVRCKIMSDLTRSCRCEHQAEAGAVPPSTRATFAHYQPQSFIILLHGKPRIGLRKSEWFQESLAARC